MNRQTRFVVLALALILILLFAAMPATARATKTDTEVIDYGCELVDPGVMWVDEEGVLHIKGQMYQGETRSSDQRLVGDSTLYVVSWNIDQATGDFTMHATGTLDPSDPNIDGIWDFVSINSHNVGGVLSARAVAHGTGDLKGLKAKMTIEALPGPPDPTVCEGTPAYVSKWFVTVFDAHSD